MRENLEASLDTSVHFEDSHKCWHFITSAFQVILFFISGGEEKNTPSTFQLHTHQSSFLETVFDIFCVLLC